MIQRAFSALGVAVLTGIGGNLAAQTLPEALNLLPSETHYVAVFQHPATTENQWRSFFAYQCAENIKQNRATLGGLLPKGKDIANDRRVHYDPSFFDSSTLQRFGK